MPIVAAHRVYTRQGVLPVATRCFSTYTTFFGEGQQLSCSPADTCNLNLAGNLGLETCGSCPTGDSERAGLSTRFGCSPVTKICTCNVPTLAESECHSNDDCYSNERSCRFLDGDFERGFGSAPCALCETNKMCFLEAGRQAGYCACGLSAVDFAMCRQVLACEPARACVRACASVRAGGQRVRACVHAHLCVQAADTPAQEDVSKTIAPRIDSMCLLTSDPQFGLSGAFTQRYDALRAVPCTRVNKAATYCTSLGDRSGPAYMVTATVTSHGRRLFAADSAPAALAANMTHDAACQDALG